MEKKVNSANGQIVTAKRRLVLNIKPFPPRGRHVERNQFIHSSGAGNVTIIITGLFMTMPVLSRSLSRSSACLHASVRRKPGQQGETSRELTIRFHVSFLLKWYNPLQSVRPKIGVYKTRPQDIYMTYISHITVEIFFIFIFRRHQLVLLQHSEFTGLKENLYVTLWIANRFIRLATDLLFIMPGSLSL